jgi:poly(A) polymerase
MKIAAAFLNWPETKAVLEALNARRPGAARFVGGCVRNAVLGRTIDDIDIATQLPPGEVETAAREAGLGAHATGVEHGTWTIVANHRPFEVTTLRRDVSTDGRRATVAFTEDWAEDAARRDFRLNALYAEGDGTLHDPTGGGLADAKAGRIIFIGDADRRLEEDFLRILRFFRFSAWYAKGALDEGGLQACARAREGLAQLSAERVWKELKKLLAAPDPAGAVKAMAQAGILERACPEAEDPGRLLRLVQLEDALFMAPDPMQRVAALLPDGADPARAFARRMKLSNEERARLLGALDPSERVVSYMSLRELRRALYRIGRQAVIDRAKLLWAASDNPKTDVQWRALVALAEGWVRPHFPLGGEAAMAAGVAAGPRVGEVLREVEAWWIDADFPDDPLALAERLKAVAQALG